MYKVFLVEDEIVVRQGIKNNIPWEEEGFVVVGDEGDGELAYAAIIESQPDILITDIQMPFMDGLELSLLVKKALPQVKIIIISGYSNFSYAQQAIDIGIAEYILKPVTAGKILSAVKNVAQLLDKERQDQELVDAYHLMLHENQSQKRKTFFQALVRGKLSLAEIISYEKEWETKMVAQAMCIVLFQFLGDHDLYEYSKKLVDQEKKFTNIIKTYPKIQAFERDMDGWALLMLGEDDSAIESLIKDLALDLEKGTKDNLCFFGGRGPTVHRTSDLPLSFQEANRAFSLRHFGQCNQILSYKEVEGRLEGLGGDYKVRELNLEKLDRALISGFLRRGSCEEIEEFVSHYFTGFGATAMNSILFQQYIMLDGYAAISKFLKDLKCPQEILDANLAPMSNFSNHPSTLETCESIYRDVLEGAIKYRNQQSQKSYYDMIEKAKAYIRREYGCLDMTLDKVAAHINISPNYFSTLFNQETGQNFIDYLTHIRMEEAKNYLRCTNKKITEISNLVGYLDPHYFSYIFRKTQNTTPSDYRKLGTGDI